MRAGKPIDPELEQSLPPLRRQGFEWQIADQPRWASANFRERQPQEDADHASAAANLMTLVASAKLHGLDPERYIYDMIRPSGHP